MSGLQRDVFDLSHATLAGGKHYNTKDKTRLQWETRDARRQLPFGARLVQMNLTQCSITSISRS